jgi:Flp pilus assembly protein TadB
VFARFFDHNIKLYPPKPPGKVPGKTHQAKNMNKTPYLRNILLAFLLFLVGQLLVYQLGVAGSWVIIGCVVIFYAWWFFQRRQKK